MDKPFASHCKEETLVQYASGELENDDRAEIDLHLKECEQCRAAMADVESTMKAYMAYHERAKAQVVAGIEWPSLDGRMRTMESVRRMGTETPLPVRRPPVLWWAAAAGFIIGTFILYQASTPRMNAAELLAKVQAGERSSEQSRRRIRIRSGRKEYVRPAVIRKGAALPQLAGLENTAERELRTRFEEARFPWENPLSATAFAHWREQLGDRNDSVAEVARGESGAGQFYSIRTRTSHGPLTDVELVVRVSDLRTVEEKFTFRNGEPVEIQEAGDAPAESPHAPGVTPVEEPPRLVAEAQAGPGEELRVWAALHGIGADLGEPVEVKTDAASGRVVVTAAGLSDGREREVRKALSGFAHAELQLEAAQPMRRTAPVAETPQGVEERNPFYTRLEARLGGRMMLEQFVNEALDRGEMALARAHALERLAARFPPQEEAALSEADKQVLASMVRDHAQALAGLGQELPHRLEPLLGNVAVTAPDCTGWRGCVEGLMAFSQQLDTLLTQVLASDSKTDPEEKTGALKKALARWSAITQAVAK